MSVNSSGTTTVSEQYNDYDTEEVFFRTEITAQDDESTLDVEYNIDPLDEMDRNEIAEIVAVQMNHNLGVRDGVQQNSELSSVRCDYSLNVNRFSGRQLDTRNVQIDVVENSNTAFTGTDGQTEVNNPVIDKLNLEATAGFASSADGFGGPGNGQGPVKRTINFRELLGGGPVIDRFDELVMRHGINTENYSGNAVAESQGVIYYATETDHDRGTSF